MPINTIADAVAKNSEAISTILISGSGALVRYLNDVRNGIDTFKYGNLAISAIIGGGIGYGMYGVVFSVLWIKDPALISSISFVIGLLGRELITFLVNSSPRFFRSFLSRISPAPLKRTDERKEQTITDA